MDETSLQKKYSPDQAAKFRCLTQACLLIKMGTARRRKCLCGVQFPEALSSVRPLCPSLLLSPPPESVPKRPSGDQVLRVPSGQIVHGAARTSVVVLVWSCHGRVLLQICQKKDEGIGCARVSPSRNLVFTMTTLNLHTTRVGSPGLNPWPVGSLYVGW